MGKMREIRVENKKSGLAYKILLAFIAVCLSLLVLLVVPVFMGAAFVHMWAYFAVGGALLSAVVALLIPFVRNRDISRMAKTVLTVVTSVLTLFALSLTVTMVQMDMRYNVSPVAYLDTPDGEYSVVLMQSYTIDDGAEYPVLTAYPMLNRFYFLLSESEEAYVQGLKSVHWRAEWEDERRLAVTITDVAEGDHLTLRLDLRDYLKEKEE